MNKVSKRCGKGNCDFYDKHNKLSGCYLFDDRINCSSSMQNRKRAANKSRNRNLESI